MELAYQSDVPIVFTEAMRNPTLTGADDRANPPAAVIVAADPAERGQGTLVGRASVENSIALLRHVIGECSGAPWRRAVRPTS